MLPYILLHSHDSGLYYMTKNFDKKKICTVIRTEAKQFLYIHNFIIVIMMYIVQKHLKSIVQPLHRGLF